VRRLLLGSVIGVSALAVLQTRLLEVRARLSQAADDSDYEGTFRPLDTEAPFDSVNGFLHINAPGH
jgi:hypothetical protein